MYIIFIVVLTAILAIICISLIYRKPPSTYSALNGFSPRLFGPPTWELLHMVSFNYPMYPTESDKSNYKQFICSLRHVIPCKKCRSSFSTHLDESQLDDALRSRDSFSRFMYDLHNKVNHTVTNPLRYNDVKKKYESLRERNNDTRRYHYRVVLSKI